MEEGKREKKRRAPYRVRAPRPGCAPSQKWLKRQRALARVPWTEQWMRTLAERDLAILHGLCEQRGREAKHAGAALSDDELRRSRLVKGELVRREQESASGRARAGAGPLVG